MRNKFLSERTPSAHDLAIRRRQQRTRLITPVTPDQTLRGLDPSWSSVPSVPSSSSTSALTSPGKPKVVGPILILLLLLLSYISSSAVILAKVMSWTYLESFNFCFLSILTVGLGPAGGSHTNSLGCIIYIFTGLILLSTVAHVFYSEVLVKIQLYGGQLTNQTDKTEGLGSLGRMMDRKRSNVFS